MDLKRAAKGQRAAGSERAPRLIMRRILYVMWKEVIELRQDPRIFGIIFIAPVVQLAVLGYAATTDVRNVPIVIVDADRSAGSQELISRFMGSGIFELVDVASSARERRSLPGDGRGMDGAVDPRSLRRECGGWPSRDAAGARGRIGRQLDEHRAGVRDQPRGRLHAGTGGTACARERGAASARRRGRHRAARARLVQPDAREPLLHAAGDLRAAAAGRHVESVVDGDRARARDRHARAVERDAPRDGSS